MYEDYVMLYQYRCCISDCLEVLNVRCVICRVDILFIRPRARPPARADRAAGAGALGVTRIRSGHFLSALSLGLRLASCLLAPVLLLFGCSRVGNAFKYVCVVFSSHQADAPFPRIRLALSQTPRIPKLNTKNRRRQ